MKRFDIAIIAGDGVGPELAIAGEKLLRAVVTKYGLELRLHNLIAAGAGIDVFGDPLPDCVREEAVRCDAVLFGNIGSNKYLNLPLEKKPERALMELRREFRVCTNLRPTFLGLRQTHYSPLKSEVVKNGFDILIVRDIMGGMFANRKKSGMGTAGREASDLEYYDEHMIEKTAVRAFEAATQRKGKVTSLDKANVLASSALWRQKVREVSEQYPSILLEHRYIDSAAMDVIREPGNFDVILTTNVFGDIISDELAQLAGTPCLFGSAELAEDGRGLYTPNQLHHSAENMAGKGEVCPICIFSAIAMMLRYTAKHEQTALAVEKAIQNVLNSKIATKELYSTGDKIVSTADLGDAVCAAL